MRKHALLLLLLSPCLLASCGRQEVKLSLHPAKDSNGWTQLEVATRGYERGKLRLISVEFKRLPDGSIDRAPAKCEGALHNTGTTVSVNDRTYATGTRWHVALDRWLPLPAGAPPVLVLTGKQDKDNWYEFSVEVP